MCNLLLFPEIQKYCIILIIWFTILTFSEIIERITWAILTEEIIWKDISVQVVERIMLHSTQCLIACHFKVLFTLLNCCWHLCDQSVLFMWTQNLVTILENLCLTEKRSQKWLHTRGDGVYRHHYSMNNLLIDMFVSYSTESKFGILNKHKNHSI